MARVKSWDLRDIETAGGSRSPVVLHSDDEARAVLIELEPGQELGDHQVKEHAFVMVVAGKAQIETREDALEAEPGMLLLFEPDERRSVSSAGGAKLLLVFAPWPGEGHYRGGEPGTGADRG
jgi:quercetin dioxygenase-like cupin family protein